MASRGKIVKNERRRQIVARYAARRAELTAILASPTTTAEERQTARHELSRQPRDASATRLRNRDTTDGRPRGYLRAFGVSRIRLRELAHQGYLPGVRKSSW
jgi:small subunit ribosomal protein S14